MILTSSPECLQALKDPIKLANLAPKFSQDISNALEVCKSKGIDEPGLELGKNLCAAAQKAMGASDLKKFMHDAALTSVPLTMSCSSFQKGGAHHYGHKAFQQVLRAYLRSLLPQDVLPKSGPERCEGSNASADINYLLHVNALLPRAFNQDFSGISPEKRLEILDSKFEVRGSSEGLRRSDVFQAIPMSTDEVAFLKQEWSDGIMSVKVIAQPFMSYDVTPPAMVSGSFAVHTPAANLCTRLASWQRDVTAAESLTGNAYASQIARLNRRCIAIHPFSDGNGRACGFWSVHALRRKALNPSIRWPHEDYSMPAVEYTKRFLEGIKSGNILWSR